MSDTKGEKEMLKAVLFDLDGVITDTAKFHFLAWRDLGAELGIIVDEAFNEELKGVSRMDSLERILAYGGLADKYSLAEKEAFCTKKNDHYLELIKEMTPADILPGILPLLEELREAGLKTIITSASKNAPGILALLQVKDYFDGIVDPASVAAGKPAPDIFLAGAELAGVQPAECIGVEDAASGVDAIKAANITAIAIGDAAVLGHADRVLTDTSDLALAVLRDTWELAV
ncbi:beta-phosphoglucomutase hydrolase [Trichococcus collinsii]|uniref:Beta-phosphoglucomutase n=2 Tax=Trichococcus collinsii TaxID=157076 RepID=A0AB38A1K6_9LACT|nr:beta-phosphoglucomutase hydrolase [Trichococcus collinsii]SEA66432.1 beta-phosphoglucomutase [Trichococcus collinsii]